MKNTTILTLIVAASVSMACSKKVDTTNSANTRTVNASTANSVLSEGTYCYLAAKNGDSMKVTLHLQGDVITGELQRLPFQKDQAKGTLRGVKTADGLWATEYSFMQEGMTQQTKFNLKPTPEKLIITGDPVYDEELNAVPCR